jgi:hypothetical protein
VRGLDPLHPAPRPNRTDMAHAEKTSSVNTRQGALRATTGLLSAGQPSVTRAPRTLDLRSVRGSVGGTPSYLSVIKQGGRRQGTTCHACGYGSRTTIRSTSRSKKYLHKLLGEGGGLRVFSPLVHCNRQWILRWTPIHLRYMACLRWANLWQVRPSGHKNATDNCGR